MEGEGTFCPGCNRNTETVFDRAAGDEVCTECGLVLQERAMDETSEWRNFADDSGYYDPDRVGGPSNPLLAEAPLTTVISAPCGVVSLPSQVVGRRLSLAPDPDRSLHAAFKSIGAMCDRLGLVATIKDRACEIYKKMEDIKSMKGRNQDAIYAACLYIACRQEDRPRTVKEISSVANGAKKKDIGRAKEFIVKQLEAEMGQSMAMGTIYAGDYLRRFCSYLGMTNQEIKVSQEAVQNSQELVIRRSPITVAAAIIYMITQLSDNKKPLKDIALATGVAEATIKSSYRDLYPYASRIIPTSFANEGDLKNLCNPYK